MSGPMHGSAEFSPCGEFRWRLDRWWADGPRALICGANPSKAGAEEMDPTMHSVVRLTRPFWPGYTMINALPYIATDPADCERWRRDWQTNRWTDYRSIKAENAVRIRALAEDAAVVIVAWGNLVKKPDADLLAALSADGSKPLHCWGVTASGAPKHPLYLKSDSRIVEWRSARS